jgi:hypothetical protein
MSRITNIRNFLQNNQNFTIIRKIIDNIHKLEKSETYKKRLM